MYDSEILYSGRMLRSIGDSLLLPKADRAKHDKETIDLEALQHEMASRLVVSSRLS
jgi:hypothetical protein